METKQFIRTKEGVEEKNYWNTAGGKCIPFSEVTQQHWSNIYWYHIYQVHQMEHYVDKMRHTMSEEDTPIVKEIAKDLINDKIKAIYRMKTLADIGIEQLNLRFYGELLEWEPQYPEEKKWYANECTRKILTEFIRIKK